MKIIKQEDVSNWSHQHTCISCNSILEVESKDLEYNYYSGDMREPSYESFKATCPVCNAEFNVPNDSIPKLIKVQVRNKKSGHTYSL